MTPPTEPTKPLGMSDFFALEAGEYLERLDALLATTDRPGADELVRLARALRGSALMANQAAIARAAAGLEALARAVREGRRAWDAATKQVAVRSVDDLKIFVRRAVSWSDTDTAKAEALAQELEQLAGRPSAQVRAAEALGLDAGARAFVAREGAAIASALDRAAQALRANPLAHDPLQAVLRALQPLRGLAAVNDLPPLPDLLEGIERAIDELSRSGLEPPANVAELFQAAATAIARSARDVAERGRPDPDGAEFRQYAALLVRFMESEPDVVSVGSLYYNDSGPHIVSRGSPVARPSALGRVELVSHGEHLRQAADALQRAASPTQRELRAHTLGNTFRALANAGGGVLADRVAQFAIAGREAVASGIAVNNPAGFASELRRVGDLLARSSSGNEDTLAAELDTLTAAIRALQPGAPPVPTDTRMRAAPVPPPAAAPPPAPPAAAPRPATGGALPETPDLAGSWAMFERLVVAGVAPASLEELVAGAGSRAPRAPAPPPAVARPGPAPAAAADLPVVDIAVLLYRGERALQRAQELRATAQRTSGDALRTLVEEVCDLVALALEPSP
jgi:HPt (histidine-containing phosphotransfer) domain-containing protein